jgi:hypothetical protein
MNVSLQFLEDGLAIETQTLLDSHEVVLAYDLLEQLAHMGEAARHSLINSAHRFHFHRGPDGMLVPGAISLEMEQSAHKKEIIR